MDNFWEKLGLEDNPYDPRPLMINEKDKKLFVGRTKELAKLNALISGDRGGIIIVEGEIGVGKTSFVNIFQYEKWKKDWVLPSFQKIELTENTDPVGFILSVFSNMLFNLEKVIDKKVLEKYPEHKKAKSYVEKTIESGFGGSLSIFGTGVGASQQKTISSPVAVLLPTILDAFDKWIEFVITKTKFTSMLIPIDNSDIVSEKQIIHFLNFLRDTLIDRKNLWWILIGQKGLSSLIENDAHRVSEMITGKPIVLEPLSLKEIKTMIKLRYENLTKSKILEIAPTEIINILYDVSKGEARYILKRTTDMVFSFITDFPSEKRIPLSVAKKMLYDEAKIRIENADLTARQTEILQNMSSVGTFQSKEFKKIKLKSAPALLGYTELFIRKGFLRKMETTGISVYYRTTGDVAIYFDKNLLG